MSILSFLNVNIEIQHYLVLSSLVFFLGIIGIFLNRKNVITILMSIELILLGVNINFVAFSYYYYNILKKIFYHGCLIASLILDQYRLFQNLNILIEFLSIKPATLGPISLIHSSLSYTSLYNFSLCCSLSNLRIQI